MLREMVMKGILEMTAGCIFLMLTTAATIQMMKKPKVSVYAYAYSYLIICKVMNCSIVSF